MNIENAKYDKTGLNNNFIVAVIDGETFNVPFDPNNKEYAEIMRQVEAGDLEIEPADEIEE